MATKVQKLQDILKELRQADAGTERLIGQQIRQTGVTEKAEIAGLGARKDQAFQDITTGANRRGLTFSGIPLAEQARYVSTDFLPAVARTQQGFQQERMTLRQALAELSANRRREAMGVQEKQKDRLYSEQQAAADRAAQLRASYSRSSASSQPDPRQQAIQSFNSDFSYFLDSARRGVSPQQVQSTIGKLVKAYPELDPIDIAKRINTVVDNPEAFGARIIQGASRVGTSAQTLGATSGRRTYTLANNPTY